MVRRVAEGVLGPRALCHLLLKPADDAFVHLDAGGRHLRLKALLLGRQTRQQDVGQKQRAQDGARRDEDDELAVERRARGLDAAPEWS